LASHASCDRDSDHYRRSDIDGNCDRYSVVHGERINNVVAQFVQVRVRNGYAYLNAHSDIDSYGDDYDEWINDGFHVSVHVQEYVGVSKRNSDSYANVHWNCHWDDYSERYRQQYIVIHANSNRDAVGRHNGV
jgi:hypothetical protein